MSSADDIISRAWAKLYNAPEHEERERLKARILELEAEIDLIPILMPIPKSAEFRAGWVAGVKAYRDAIRERRATRNAP